MKDCKYCFKYTKGFQRADLDNFLAGDEYHGDFNLRWERMNGVVDSILKKYNNPKIADLAMGGGGDTIALLKRGYRVISNEVNTSYVPAVLEKAKNNAVSPEIRIEDWRNILQSNKYKDEEFDIVLVLGNSFPAYLLSKEDREKALKGFWRILKPGGTLFFDTRNYDYILDNQKIISDNPETNFKYLGKTTYLKNGVYKLFPVLISGDSIHFCAKDFLNKQYDCIDCWPATEGGVKEMIIDCLGNIDIDVYYDYEKEKSDHYDFVQYKLIKR